VFSATGVSLPFGFETLDGPLLASVLAPPAPSRTPVADVVVTRCFFLPRGTDFGLGFDSGREDGG
jgi:hypothetical protein